MNSLHGQGADRLAPGLAVEAVAPDGLVEAFRLDRTDNFLLGVQWAPRMGVSRRPAFARDFRRFPAPPARAFQAARLGQPSRRLLIA